MKTKRKRTAAESAFTEKAHERLSTDAEALASLRGGVKERPILFSAPMVRAILAGAKTQTRRVIRPEWARCLDLEDVDDRARALEQGPYGVPGDRLWVRETFHHCPHCSDGEVAYRAGGWMRAPNGAPDDAGDRSDDDARPLSPKCAAHGWRPSIHMPRWASRLTLEVVSVRVERLQDTSEADAKAEGVVPLQMDHGSYKPAFEGLWDAINAKRAPWNSNPWVFVVEFKMVVP